MTMTDPWKLLLHDYVASLIPDAVALKERNAQQDSFSQGQRAAYYDCLDRLRQLAVAFDLDASEIGLAGIDLERSVL